MTMELDSLADFTLESYRRIAWEGASVHLSDAAWQRLGAARESFLRMIDNNPEMLVYGVTSGFGDAAAELLDEAGRRRQAKQPPYSLGLGVGDPLPARVVRGIVFARLAAFIEGHAAVSPGLVAGVVEMLDGRPLPALPLGGQLASGEVDPLNGIFHHLMGEPCEMKDGGSLVNGAPCSAALAAEAALRTRRRLALIQQVFALSVEAGWAKLEVFDPVLATAWDDPHDQAALLELAGLLAGADPAGRPAYQPPVSWRIIPKVVGQLHRALAALEAAAGHALRTPGDNPLYFGPDAAHPDGRTVSNGSFHDGASYPAIDGASFALADLTVMTGRQAERLHNPQIAGSAANRRNNPHGHSTQPLLYLQSWFGTKARDLARPTFLPPDDGGHLKSDILLPTFYAYEKHEEVAACLEQCLAGLAAIASQVLWERGLTPAPALRGLLAEVRETFPPIESLRPIGAEIGKLQADFAAKSLVP